MASFVNTFGGYAYNNQIEMISENDGRRSRTSKPANYPGGYTAGSILDIRKFSIRGIISYEDTSSRILRDAEDAFRKAHRPGLPRVFQIDSDRYISAEVEGLSFGEWDGLPSKSFTVDFRADDPHYYSNVLSNINLINNSTTNFAAGGSAPSLGVYTIPVTSGANSANAITISTSDGTFFTIAPSQNRTYTIDCLNETVVDDTGTDRISEFNGRFIYIFTDSSPHTVSSTGLSLGTISAKWYNRYY